MKRIGILLLAVIAAAAGALGYARWTDHNGDERANALELFGNVEIRDADLAFNGEGHIAAVLVEEGDRISAGQPLAQLTTNRLNDERKRLEAEIDAQAQAVARLESGTRKQEIELARANVTAAEARERNASRMVERLRDTANMGASSAQDLDDALARLDVERAMLNARRQELELAVEGPRKEDIAEARAHLAAARAGLDLLAQRIADAVLTAPSDGIIQRRIMEPGEFATPSRPVLTLALQDPKWIRAYIPEPDLGRIREGMRSVVRSDSYPDRSFDAWVGFISPIAEFTPKSVQTTDLRPRLVYEVRVYVNDPDNQLRLGQPVTVVVNDHSHPTTANTNEGRTTAPTASAPAASKAGA